MEGSLQRGFFSYSYPVSACCVEWAPSVPPTCCVPLLPCVVVAVATVGLWAVPLPGGISSGWYSAPGWVPLVPYSTGLSTYFHPQLTCSRLDPDGKMAAAVQETVGMWEGVGGVFLHHVLSAQKSRIGGKKSDNLRVQIIDGVLYAVPPRCYSCASAFMSPCECDTHLWRRERDLLASLWMLVVVYGSLIPDVDFVVQLDDYAHARGKTPGDEVSSIPMWWSEEGWCVVE
jgi:hypothetical protein